MGSDGVKRLRSSCVYDGKGRGRSLSTCLALGFCFVTWGYHFEISKRQGYTGLTEHLLSFETCFSRTTLFAVLYMYVLLLQLPCSHSANIPLVCTYYGSRHGYHFLLQPFN
jgi:hypothetical protein